MDLLKTPSVQSLLDSDVESVEESLQNLDFEELDELEYALPTSEAPTLAEVLLADDEEGVQRKTEKVLVEKQESTTCSALQVDFLQAVSQQLLQAQERSSAGAATALGVGTESKLTVGTAHGHLLTFNGQTLRWVCDSNTDRGAVSSLCYSQDSSRLLAGYARGLICQYESIRGVVLRCVTLGCDIWGTLRVAWAGTSGLALDTGGSVWLIKFSRPLGVRSARTSCLFSGARGEVVAMAAQDARILALATLSRVIIVAGGRAAGVRLSGPADTLPVLAWCENDNRMLVCARATTLQWVCVNITGSNISLRPVKRVELKTTPLWIGWLGGSLAILDMDEKLRLCGDDYDKPLDLSHIEPVYASAFFKGVWTGGRVSTAMSMAGASALGGVCVADGAMSLLGRRGVLRVRPRDLLARARSLFNSARYSQALQLLCSTQGPEARALAKQLVVSFSESPHTLSNKQVADQVVKLCVKYNLSEEIWGCLWEGCNSEQAFVEAVGEAVVRGELTNAQPSPDHSQALIERLAELEPSLVERVVASLPLTSLDPHRASVFTRSRGLWRGVGAIAAALGGGSGALTALVEHVRAGCGASRDGACACAGSALLVAAADALAGRGPAGRALPDHARPSARHQALTTLLSDEAGCSGRSPLHILVQHDARSAVRLLEQSARDPPFAGPLAKHNRLRVARALLQAANHLQEPDERIEIIEFITNQLNSSALPCDKEVIKDVQELAAATSGERADRAWLSLAARVPREQLQRLRSTAPPRPRLHWRLDAALDRHDDALREFFDIEDPSPDDVDDLLEYLNARIEAKDLPRDRLEPHLPALVALRPRTVAALVGEHFPDSIASTLNRTPSAQTLEFAEELLASGRLGDDAAAVHLRNLSTHRPEAVRDFLVGNPGILRPEDALRIVREAGCELAEPVCLEAAGDPEAALDTLLRLAAATPDLDTERRLIAEAGELCARAAAASPPATAAAMWTRLVRRPGGVPPALLLEAAAHLPVEDLVGEACGSARVALSVVRGAAARAHVWACAAQVRAREAHAAGARTRRAAARALCVRGGCSQCGAPLWTRPPVRTGHCARASHAECGSEQSCGACGLRVPELVTPLAARPPRRLPPPFEDALVLMAPPRPDLEGVA